MVPSWPTRKITALAVAPHSADVILRGGGRRRDHAQRRSGAVLVAWNRYARRRHGPGHRQCRPRFRLDGCVALAGTEAHGLYRTLDHGTTWHYLEDFPRQPPSQCSDAGCPVHSSRSRAIKCGGSPDGGDEWMRRAAEWSESRLAAGSEQAPATASCWAGVNGTGVIRSEDGGWTWASSSAGLTSLPVLDLKPSPDFAARRRDFGRIGDRGASCGPLTAVVIGPPLPTVCPRPRSTAWSLSPTFAQERHRPSAVGGHAGATPRMPDAPGSPLTACRPTYPVMAAALLANVR